MSRNYVLVHGAYHGGWCWNRVAERLRAAGHRVFATTATGMGERQHLLDRKTTLMDWVEDVVQVIEAEELSEVILVGHSFGGNMISGVADRMKERLRHLVYFDAIVPKDGASFAGGLDPADWMSRQKNLVEIRGVPCLRAPAPEFFGLSEPADIEWVRRRVTPMSATLFTTPIGLRHPTGNGVPATFVYCSRPPLPVIEGSWRYAQKTGWRCIELPECHDAMVSAPDAVARIFLEVP